MEEEKKKIFEKPQTKLEFYKSQIVTAKHMLRRIGSHGLDALHEVDKSKGVEKAKEMFKNDVDYFEGKLKDLEKSD